jgi:transposase-like protein
MASRKRTYTPAPHVSPDLAPRLTAIIDVLSGATTVSEAARSLGLSRVHFQTILHRAVAGLVAAMAPKPGGRPRRPDTLVQLQAELARAKRENARLASQVASTGRLLTVASELLQGRVRPATRRKRARRARGANRHGGEDGEPAVVRGRTLALLDDACRLGMTMRDAAALAGYDASTVRRWRAAGSNGLVGAHRVPQKAPSAALVAQADQLVRRLHGLIGADALHHRVEGLSRRAAAAVKAKTLTAMEQERKAALTHVEVLRPGVLRGMDAMHVATDRGVRYALIGGDGAVPYRTSAASDESYDTALVIRALERDVEAHGAPLVLRMDRASMHRTDPVRALVDAHRILVLHGPPHYPAFYGQLERQNREHRAWLDALPVVPAEALEACLGEMLAAVNEYWPRRSLGWRTPADAWRARAPLVEDRDALREEVHDRATRIAMTMKHRGDAAELAERLAIERALELRGYLRQTIGGWC